MRLLELHLQAFGPFTDCRLDLSAGQSGLHILHGPNEAGKSSALRALHALLFGFPARTRDNFLHGSRDLRVGARLRSQNGQELHCYRHKGNKNTLLSAEQQSLPEEQLSRMLGGVDAELFQRLFGIDHHTLVSGGEKLLAEQGTAADALFGADLGKLNLREVAATLASEADAIFRPQATKPLLNQELVRYRELERSFKQADLSPREWHQAAQALTEAEQALRDIQQSILTAETRRRQLERVRRTQPNLARLQELDVQLDALGPLPTLPEDFSARRQQSERQLHQANSAQASAAARLAGLQQQVAALPVQHALLSEAEAIDSLSEALGSYRKAAQDRSSLVTQHDTLGAQISRVLAVARPGQSPDEVESLRPLLALQRSTQTLAVEGAQLQATTSQAHKSLRKLDHQLNQRQARLDACPAPPATAALEDVITAARHADNLDALIDDSQAELTHSTEQAERALAAAGLWPADLPALCRAALPSETQIAEMIEREQTLAQAAERIASAIRDNQTEQARTRERLQALQRADKIPTEAQLLEARDQREQLWQHIKARCCAATPPAPEDNDPSLPERFESQQSAADHLADRLRREAEQVHEQAAAQTSLEQAQKQATALEQQAREQEAASAALNQAWQALWAPLGIEPHSPRAMRDWRAQVRPLIEQAEQRSRLAHRIQGLEQERSRQLQALNDAWPPPDATPSTRLAPQLQQAERELAQRLKQAQERASLAAACTELRARQQELQAETTVAANQLQDWQLRWQNRLAELGLPANRDAVAVAEDFERLAQMFTLIDQQLTLGARIHGIDADAQAFTERARAQLARLTPDLHDTELEPALGALRQRLARERETHSRRAELISQCQQAEQELASITATQAGAQAALDELCRLAGAPAPEALAELETRIQHQQHGQRERAAIIAELRTAGDGRPLDELNAEAQTLDADVLSAELQALEQQLQLELRPREHAAIERKLNAQQALEAMDGSALAAERAEELAQSRARLQRLSQQWIQLRFAARLLTEAKERFAEQHCDPLLPRIAHYFAQLTQDAFGGVEIDFDQGEHPVLLARRASGQRLGVEALSTGTRDQLYLALRLATLEQRAARTEPLPLIVDDILVQFDDQRSRATLATLAEFSHHTQVLLMTHHRYVIEQARALQASPPDDGSATVTAKEPAIFVHAMD
ncbi:ATP-binding protein [Rhabdochromatium marinum]|uniref:ATP-binding protein n=1 Tax=Rhabdochromatium marinum TaxID=48729 RepID=UPI0019039315|nr:YhaN family protein [Rhabdochromatium marinum]